MLHLTQYPIRRSHTSILRSRSSTRAQKHITRRRARTRHDIHRISHPKPGRVCDGQPPLGLFLSYHAPRTPSSADGTKGVPWSACASLRAWREPTIVRCLHAHVHEVLWAASIHGPAVQRPARPLHPRLAACGLRSTRDATTRKRVRAGTERRAVTTITRASSSCCRPSSWSGGAWLPGRRRAPAHPSHRQTRPPRLRQ